MIEPATRVERLDALRALEVVLAAAPSPDDRIAAWLAPRMVRRLGNASIADVGIDMRAKGRHWQNHHRGIGATQAKRLAAWLDEVLEPGHLAAVTAKGKPGRPATNTDSKQARSQRG